MKKAVLLAVKYFKNFDYPVSFDEIYCFIQKKTSKIKLHADLASLIKNKTIIYNKKYSKYTVGEYSINKISNIKIQISNLLLRQAISKRKIKKICLYVKLLALFSQIKLIGLSGSLAMSNANANDDIDLFIITDKQRLWTGRLICVLIAQLMGIRRNRLSNQTKDKICLNLFIDSSHLVVPRKKQTVYVAHEILQMKPLINKQFIYEQFLKANNWVYKIFPNFPAIITDSVILGSMGCAKSKSIFIIGDYIETILKKLQLLLINKHKTKEIITKYQLWFFPKDFEKKINDFI